MSIWRHQKFDPAAEYVVSKELLFGGRTFKRGELFDVETTDRQRRILYDARFLRLAPANLIKQLAVNTDLILDEQEVAELNALIAAHEATQDQTGVELEPEPEPEIEPVKLERRIVLAGRGWYRIEIGPKGCGNFLSDKKVRLKEAEKLLAQ